MRLAVSTPLAVVLDARDAAHVRAEDASGAFGILTGHAPFVTALSVCVVTWRDGAGAEHYVAVRAGVLSVRNDGQTTVSIATPEAVADDDLARLEAGVLSVFRDRLAREQSARTDARRLYLAAINRILRYLRPERVPETMRPGGAARELEA